MLDSKGIVGIVLAAGVGRRMGCIKQLLYCDKHILLQKVLFAAEASNLSRVVLVLGYESEKILGKLKSVRARVVINSDYKLGQSGSIKTGLLEADNNCKAAMFILGDQPLITKGIINTLIDAYPLAMNKNVIIPVYSAKRGNPVVFGRHFFDELMSLVGDVGGKALMKYYEDDIIEVTVDNDAILFDIDTYEDYKRYRQRW